MVLLMLPHFCAHWTWLNSFPTLVGLVMLLTTLNHLCIHVLLTLSVHAQRGLQQLSRVSVCLSVCLLPLFQQTEH